MFFMNEVDRCGNYKLAFNNHLRFFGSYFSESLYRIHYQAKSPVNWVLIFNDVKNRLNYPFSDDPRENEWLKL